MSQQMGDGASRISGGRVAPETGTRFVDGFLAVGSLAGVAGRFAWPPLLAVTMAGGGILWLAGRDR